MFLKLRIYPQNQSKIYCVRSKIKLLTNNVIFSCKLKANLKHKKTSSKQKLKRRGFIFYLNN